MDQILTNYETLKMLFLLTSASLAAYATYKNHSSKPSTNSYSENREEY